MRINFKGWYIAMKFPIYSVRDDLTGFGYIFLSDNDATASRSFEYDCTIPNSKYSVHPEHYSVYCIGDFDTDSGAIEPCLPRFVASASDFVKKE